MKKILFLALFFFYIIAPLKSIHAQATPTPPYEPCLGAWCPSIIQNYTCATSYSDWERNKSQNLWVSDPEVTALGKAGERSRQFLYWTLTHRSIDDHPVILSIWSFAKNIVYFFLLIIAAIFGLGIIIGQRANFNLKIEVWPLILKIMLLLLYVTFSARLVLLVIQLSDTMMLFFIERLGVKNLFNIFFLQSQGGSVILDSEAAYKTFKGCSNLNIELLDSVKTSKFMVHFTNMTYYMVGIMFILRKVVLWLLLFVSPFLALLMPFVFIRNAGWVWIGVFFQWVLYGPLFGLFLGGLAAIWGSPSHIPFNFDFSRANRMEGFIYPTTINILYGGPAQKLELLNSSNYADTYAEYIIALVMLWAVTIFPWWLLRIFRDYCCEGIYATKNILLSMYDQMRAAPTPFGPVPVPAPSGLATGTAMQIPKDEHLRTVTKLETSEEIKRTRTEDISRSLQFSVSRLTDIARFETNKQNQETITKNINFLQNPMKAETPSERQKFMNIRSELFSRAVKEDKTAKQVLSSLSTSKVEQMQRREEILKSTSQAVPVTHIVSVKVSIPTEKVQSVTSSFVQSVAQNTNMVQSISQTTQIPQNKVQSVLTAFSQNISQPTTKIVQNIANQTGIAKEKVSSIIQTTTNVVRQSQLIDKIATKEQVETKSVERILSSISTVLQSGKETVVNSISRETSVPVEQSAAITKSILTTVANDNSMLQSISQITQQPQATVQSVLSAYTQNISQPVTNLVQNIANQTGVTKEKVSSIIQNATNVIRQSQLTDKIATQEQVTTQNVEKVLTSISDTVQSEKQTSSITKSIFTAASSDKSLIQTVAQTTQVPQAQVQTVLTSYTQNISQPAEKLVETIASQTNLSKEKISSIIQNTTNVVSQSQLIEKIAAKEQVTSQSVERVLSAIPQTLIKESERREKETVVNVVSTQAGISQVRSNSIVNNLLTNVSNDNAAITQIEKQTNVPSQQVRSVLQTFVQNINQPFDKAVNTVTERTGLQKEKVTQIVNTTLNTLKQSEIVNQTVSKEQITKEQAEKIITSIPQTLIKEKESVVSILSTQIGIPLEKTTAITRTLLSSVSSDRTFIKQLEKQTSLPAAQVTKILNSFTENINQPITTSVENISTQTGVEKEKVIQVISSTVNNLKSSKDTVKQILQKENIKEKDLEKIVENQIPVVAEPEKYVESTISIPPSISLDEYEQVKKMWKDQYERGEVPVSDVIKSRDQWVGQDVIFITNVLNKLVSESPEVKQQGLDDLGYILPIFLINNLKGDQLMVYLKAKLEAAKEVEALQQKEEEVKEEVEEKKEEEFVEVEKPKEEEAEKVMEMKEELEEKPIEEKSSEENKQIPSKEETEMKKPEENNKD